MQHSLKELYRQEQYWHSRNPECRYEERQGAVQHPLQQGQHSMLQRQWGMLQQKQQYPLLQEPQCDKQRQYNVMLAEQLDRSQKQRSVLQQYHLIEQQHSAQLRQHLWQQEQQRYAQQGQQPCVQRGQKRKELGEKRCKQQGEKRCKQQEQQSNVQHEVNVQQEQQQGVQQGQQLGVHLGQKRKQQWQKSYMVRGHRPEVQRKQHGVLQGQQLGIQQGQQLCVEQGQQLEVQQGQQLWVQQGQCELQQQLPGSELDVQMRSPQCSSPPEQLLIELLAMQALQDNVRQRMNQTMQTFMTNIAPMLRLLQLQFRNGEDLPCGLGRFQVGGELTQNAHRGIQELIRELEEALSAWGVDMEDQTLQQAQAYDQGKQLLHELRRHLVILTGTMETLHSFSRALAGIIHARDMEHKEGKTEIGTPVC